MDKLSELLRRLHNSGVEFSLIGGLAAVQYGTSYVTYDLDICASFSRDNLERFHSAVSNLNPHWRTTHLPFGLAADASAELKDISLTTDCGDLDCKREVSPIGSFRESAQESQLVEFPFGQCYVLRIEPLIRTKEVTGRPEDLFVVTQLRAVAERAPKQN